MLVQIGEIDGSTYWTLKIYNYSLDKKEMIVYVIKECEQNNHNKIYIVDLSLSDKWFYGGVSNMYLPAANQRSPTGFGLLKQGRGQVSLSVN